MKEEIKKILLECIYTPDAKPRFVGGDVDKKLAYIDETVKKIVSLQGKSVNVKKTDLVKFRSMFQNFYKDAEMALDDTWDRSDSGFEAIQSVSEDGMALVDKLLLK